MKIINKQKIDESHLDPRLAEFLKTKDALDKFLHNINKANTWTIYNCKYVDIATAFTWAKTPEGYKYWSHISAYITLLYTIK